MYFIKAVDNYNIYINDLQLFIKYTDAGNLITNEQYAKSNDLRTVIKKGIIVANRIIDREEYNLQQEIFTLNKNTVLINLQNGKYKTNQDNITVYINGNLLSSSDFIEYSENSIMLNYPLTYELNNVVIQYIDYTVSDSLPNDSYISDMFKQEVFLPANTVKITLRKPLINISRTIVFLFLDGILMPNTSFYVNDEQHIYLMAPITDSDCYITILCFQYKETTAIPPENGLKLQNKNIKKSKSKFNDNVDTIDDSIIDNIDNINNNKGVKKNAKSKILGWFSMGRSGRSKGRDGS